MEDLLLYLTNGVVMGTTYALAALGVTLIGERFRGAALAAATTAFTASWGLGTIVGPLVAGMAMDRYGDGSLALVAAGFFLLYLPLPLRAWWQERRRLRSTA